MSHSVARSSNAPGSTGWVPTTATPYDQRAMSRTPHHLPGQAAASSHRKVDTGRLIRRPGNARIGGRGEIAQLVEHSTENRGVGGSSPPLAIAKSLQMGGFSDSGRYLNGSVWAGERCRRPIARPKPLAIVPVLSPVGASPEALRTACSGDKWLIYAVLTRRTELHGEPRIKGNKRRNRGVLSSICESSHASPSTLS